MPVYLGSFIALVGAILSAFTCGGLYLLFLLLFWKKFGSKQETLSCWNKFITKEFFLFFQAELQSLLKLIYNYHIFH